MSRPIGWAALWGVLGFTALIGQAVYKLTPFAVDAVRMPLAPGQWVALAAWIAFMIYSEGYRGFQKKLAPRVAARAVHLTAHPRPVHVALAPLYMMGLIHATRRRLVASWLLLAMIVTFVIIVRTFAQPWRGIVDAGVVLGLVWGIVATLVFVARAARGAPVTASPEVPT